MQYKSKPVVINAMQWTGENSEEVVEWVKLMNGAFNYGTDGGTVWGEIYDYLQGAWIPVNVNDYIITGTKGEHYPCDPEVFAEKYEPLAGTSTVGGLVQPTITKMTGTITSIAGKMIL